MRPIRYFYYPETGFVSWGYGECKGVEIPYDLYLDMIRFAAIRKDLYAEWTAAESV